MRVLTFAAMAGISIGLGSCATLDKNQCLAGDWAGIGYQDGASGRSQSRLGEHNEACAKHGVTPDADAYYRGRQEGLRTFCTPARGFAEARVGHSYGRVCPPDLERGFLAGFAEGGLVAAAQRRLDEARSDRSSAENRERDYENQIRDEEVKLTDSANKPEDKDRIRQRIRQLRDDRERAQDDARRADRRERDAQYEMDGLKARFVRVYGPW